MTWNHLVHAVCEQWPLFKFLFEKEVLAKDDKTLNNFDVTTDLSSIG